MSATAAQPILGPQTAGARPLMPLIAVAWRLDLDREDVMELIESGAIPWAFHIGLKANRGRRVVRILTECVEDLVLKRKRPEDDASEWSRISALIFPARTVITTPELAGRLCCDSGHVMNLVKDNQIEVPNGIKWPRGPHGAARITVESAKAWLKQRRVY